MSDPADAILHAARPVAQLQAPLVELKRKGYQIHGPKTDPQPESKRQPETGAERRGRPQRGVGA